jgi:protein-S-isoprenylcysteine O-methyltransferase Ste14
VSHVVSEGPFRYTRNPAYLSMAMIYTAIASLANALWAIIMLPIALLVIQRGVIEREERYLERKFGEEYLRYKARVRRWISAVNSLVAKYSYCYRRGGYLCQPTSRE